MTVGPCPTEPGAFVWSQSDNYKGMNPVPAVRPSASQIWVTLPFFAFGMFALLGGLRRLCVNPEVLLGHPYRLPVIGFSHCVGLGFLFSMVAGACYQLVPVVTGNPLFCRKSPYVHLALHCLGMPLLVHGMLRADRVTMAAGAGCVVGGIAIFLLNIIATVVRPFRATPTSAGLLAALGFLCIGISLAAWMVASRFGGVALPNPLMIVGVHAYIMVFGFFVSLLMAVTFALLPMFLLSPSPHPGRSSIALSLHATGLTLGSIGSFFAPLLGVAGAIIAAAGIGFFCREAWGCVAARARPMDAGLKLFAISLGFLPLAAVVVIARVALPQDHSLAAIGRLDVVAFITVVFGALGGTLLGMGGKIAPFLIWQKRYAPAIGDHQVPKLSDLSPRWLFQVTACLYPCAAFALISGSALNTALLVRTGGGLAAIAWLFFVLHLGATARHLLRPRLTKRPRPQTDLRPDPPLVLPST